MPSSLNTESFTDNQVVEDPQATESPKKVLEFVKDAVASSEVYRNKFSVMAESMSWLEDANKYEDLYNGHLYTKRKKFSYECKEDIYAEAVDFNATLLTQFDLDDYIKQVTDEDESLDGEIITRILNWCWGELNDGKSKEEDMLRISGQMGVGPYVFQPMESEDGYLWPGHEVVDPRQIFISPGATGPKDAVYMGRKRPVPTYELRQKFPQFKDSIKPDKDISDFSARQTGNDGSVQVLGLGTAAQLGMNKLLSLLSGKEASVQTMLTEMFYRDPEIMTLKSNEEVMAWVAGNPGFGSQFFQAKTISQYQKRLLDNPKGLKVKKFPFGKKILVTRDVVLTNVPNPFPFFPYPTTKCYRRPKTYWAKGVEEKIRESAQNEQMISAGLAANIDFRNRSSYYCKTSQTVNVKKVPTEPNELLIIPGDIQPIPVPPVATQDVMGLINYRAMRREQVAGLPGILGGINPTGNYSGTQTNQLMEAAMGKVAPRFRDFVRCKKDLMGMYLWFFQNYCTDERVLEFMSQGEKLMVQLNQLQMQGDGPAAQPVILNDVTKGNYVYMVDTDVNQPATPSQKFTQIQAAAKVIAPISPITAIKWQLEALPVKNKFKYIAEFEQAMNQQQEIQGRQQQMDASIRQMQLEMARNKQERELDTKEIIAGAKSQESLAWVIQALIKATTDAQLAGVALPPQLMNEIQVLASRTSQEVSQAETIGQPGAVPPPVTPVGMSAIPQTPMVNLPGGGNG